MTRQLDEVGDILGRERAKLLSHLNGRRRLSRLEGFIAEFSESKRLLTDRTKLYLRKTYRECLGIISYFTKFTFQEPVIQTRCSSVWKLR